MISTKGRYALRVMIDLATQASDDYIPLKEIAERQEISEKSSTDCKALSGTPYADRYQRQGRRL